MKTLAALRQSKFARDTAWLGLGKLAVTGLGFASTLIVMRVLGPSEYGLFALADSLVVLFSLVDVSGASTSTSTRLAAAAGADDRVEGERVLAYGVQASIATRVLVLALLLLGGVQFAAQAQGSAAIGVMAVLLAAAGPADALYGQLLLALQARRSMAAASAMQSINQAVLTVFIIVAVLAAPVAPALVVARLLYSHFTLLIMLVLYAHQRERGEYVLPSLGRTLRLALRQSPRAYWRFGLASAIDRNVASMMPTLIVQSVGAAGGPVAAGFLSFGMRAIAQLSVLSGALLDNLSAAVPQAVARGEYQRLWRIYLRLQAVVALAAGAFFGAAALSAPLLIPLLFRAQWGPAVPAFIVMCLYGVITTLGGNFGPLYRAFHMLYSAIGAKLAALAISLPVATLLIHDAAQSGSAAQAMLGTLAPAEMSIGVHAAAQIALAGALSVTLLFGVSVLLTGVLSSQRLYRLSRVAKS
jgi:O-antigen/teichoic acid export membrane protein